jgi:hypothetical protein
MSLSLPSLATGLWAGDDGACIDDDSTDDGNREVGKSNRACVDCDNVVKARGGDRVKAPGGGDDNGASDDHSISTFNG